MKSPDEAYALAASVQEGFTKDEFIAAMDEIRKEEFSDTDLESLAGGDETDVMGSLLLQFQLFPPNPRWHPFEY